MDPVAGERVPHGQPLRPLVFMMGKGQVQPTTVEVESIAQEVHAHHHALGMPARSAGTPRTGPLRHILWTLGLFPQGKVDG